MINFDYLRPLKAKAVKKWYEEPFVKRDDLRVEVFTNATVLPLKKLPGDNVLFGRGGVVNSYGNYQPISGIPGRVFFDYPVEETEKKDEKVVYCGYLVPQWGHFLPIEE